MIVANKFKATLSGCGDADAGKKLFSELGEAGCVGGLSRFDAGAWEESRGGVFGWPIESQPGEQIQQFLGLQLFFEAFGHEREWAGFLFFNFVAGDDFLFVTLHFEYDALRAVFDQQSGDNATFRGDDGLRLIGGADNEAGIEYI